MSFIYPLGLIGLIGVPILIIIYIIKNKHTEQFVTSTYLWDLSEKFLKKKRQLNFLSGIISLILQIVLVIVISLVLAHPIISIPNAAKEYCFIFDASGSMNMVVDGTTKMEKGIKEIEEIITSSTEGSKYTLVYAGDTTRVLYEKLGNKEKAIELLNKIEPSGVTVSYNTTLTYVQDYFNENSSLVTYLVTDRDYSSKNVKIINVSNHEDNYAILDMKYEIVENKLKVSGNVISYENYANLNVSLYIDDALASDSTISVNKLVEKPFEFESTTVNFESIKVVINNEDGLMLDNTKIIYNIEKEHAYTTLIVSDRPFYIYSAIQAYGNTTIEMVTPENYDPETSGYSLYVFDAFTPEVLPDDGTLWLFGVENSISEAGFSVQDIVENEEGMDLTYPKNTTSTYRKLTTGLLKEQIVVSKYVKYGLYHNFTTLLTHEGNPVIFTGTTKKGNREVVFAFDLHDSNLTLLMDYLTLTGNLLEYSFPIVMEKSSYTCGEYANINVLPNFDSIRVESPNGNIQYLDVNSESVDLKLTEAGVYKLIVMIDDEAKVFSIYVSLPEEESNTSLEQIEFDLQGELGNEYKDGIYDKLIILFIIFAVIFMADWMVYCYEQYQLR